MWKWETEQNPKGVVIVVHNILEHHGRYAWLITRLRRDGFHVVMGDLPGQGQTSRVNKGHIDNFNQYKETVLEWMEVAEEFHLPIFVIGVGLGGLIMTRILEEVQLKIEGLILISPLLGFKTTSNTRKNFLASGLSSISRDAKFDMNIQIEDLTKEPEIIKETKADALMVHKVSFNWYKSIIEEMKVTMEHLHQMSNVPLLLMYSDQDKLADTELIKEFSKGIETDELYVKNWKTLYHELHNEPERDNVLYYIESFMNNRLNYVGLVTESK